MTAIQLPLSRRQQARNHRVMHFLIRAMIMIMWRVLLPAQLLLLWIECGGLQTWQ